MKKVLLILLLLSTQFISNAQWTKLDGPYGSRTTCIARADTFIMCGTTYGPYKSVDEGVTWTNNFGGTLNPTNSILIMSDTILLTYTDYSAWSSTFSSTFSLVSFDDGFHFSPSVMVGNEPWLSNLQRFGAAIITTGNDNIYQTYDFGSTWLVMPMPSGQFFESCKAYPNHLLISTHDNLGMIRKYVCDTSLFFSEYDTSNLVHQELMIDTLLFGYKSSSVAHYDIVKSNDFGQSWNPVLTVDSSPDFQLSYSGDSLFYTEDKVQYWASTDTGLSWNLCPHPHAIDYLFDLPLANGDKLAYSNLMHRLVHYIPANDSVYFSDFGIYNIAISDFFGENGDLYCANVIDFLKSSDFGQTWKPECGSLFGEVWFSSGDTVLTDNDPIMKSFDGGYTWSAALSQSGEQNFVMKGSRIFSSSTGGTVYSDDLGDTWNQVQDISGFYTSCGNIVESGGKICVMGENVFMITGKGDAYKLDSTDQFWTHLFCFRTDVWTHYNHYPDIRNIENTLVVTCDSAMFLSHDGGLSWTHPLMYGAPLNSQNQITCPQSIVGRNGQLIGIGDDDNIYTTFDGGDNWMQMSSGPQPFHAYEIVLLDSTLFASSLGEGIWRYGDIINSSRNIVAQQNALLVYPNPASENFRLSLVSIPGTNYHLYLTNTGGQRLKTLHLNQEENVVNVEDLQTGIYFGTVYSSSGELLQTFKVSVMH